MVAQFLFIEKTPSVYEKSQLRKKLIEARATLSGTRHDDLSRQAQNALLNTPLWTKVEKIGLYASLPQEVSTALLMERALEEGKKLLLPKITDRTKSEMQFGICRHLSDLSAGALGILEPPTASAEIVPEIIIVPGLAFDRKGNRLGYGGGYYDKYLATHTSRVTIGFCFSFQIIERVPVNFYDQRVKALCSNGGFVWL